MLVLISQSQRKLYKARIADVQVVLGILLRVLFAVVSEIVFARERSRRQSSLSNASDNESMPAWMPAVPGRSYLMQPGYEVSRRIARKKFNRTNGSDPNWKGTCLENRCAQALRVRVHATSAKCAISKDSNAADCNPATRQCKSVIALQARVVQLAETADSKPAKCRFNSYHEHHARLGKLVNPAALEAAVSRFESETGHQLRKSVNGKPDGSNPSTVGSSPTLRAIVLSSRGSGCSPVEGEIAGSNPVRTEWSRSER